MAFGFIKRLARNIYRTTGMDGPVRGAEHIKNLWHASFGDRDRHKVVPRSFDQAIRMYGLTDADLADRHDGLMSLCGVAMVFSAGVLAFGIARYLAATTGVDGFQAAIIAFMAGPFLVQAGIWRFRAWQIERRALDAVSAWLSDGREWAANLKWLTIAGVFSAALVALFHVAPAMAAEPSSQGLLQKIMHPATDDQSVIWLRQLFGEAAGGTASALSEVIGTLNAGLAATALGLVGYVGLKAATATAEEGVFLGRASRTGWGIARMVGAATALAPVKAGFTLLQVAVVAVATWGIGLANITWSAVTEATIAGKPLAVFTVPSAAPLARGLLENLICVELVNHMGQVSKAYGQTSSALRVQRADHQTTATYGALGDALPMAAALAGKFADPRPDKLVTSWDGLAGSGLPPAACGAVQYGALVDAVDGATGELSRTIRGNAALQKLATDTMILELRPLARQFARAVLEPEKASFPERAGLVSILQGYSEVIAAQASKVAAAVNADAGDQFRRVTQAGGWTEAGAWWMRIGEMNRTVHAVANIRPEVSGPQYSALAANPDYAQFVERAQATFPAWWNVAAIQTYQPPGSRETRETLGAAASFGDIENLAQNPSSVIERAFPTNELFAFLFDNFDNLNEDAPAWTPAALMDTGNSIINSAIGGLAIYAGARMAAAGIKETADGFLIFGKPLSVPAKVALELFQSSAWLVASVATSLLVIGVTLAYVVPFMPFFHFMMSVVAWVILVAEGVVAASLWAIAHIRIDGDGLPGPQAAGGYFFLLNIFIRPVFIVISLVLAIAMFSLVANYYSRLFFTTSTGVLQNIGPIDALAALAIYTFGLIVIAGTVFSMVGEIGDRAMRWIGGQASNFSDHGVTRDVEGRAVAGAAVIASRGRSLPGPASQPGGRRRPGGQDSDA